MDSSTAEKGNETDNEKRSYWTVDLINNVDKVYNGKNLLIEGRWKMW